MAAFTDDQWDNVLGRAETSGVWTLDDTNILQGLINSQHTFGLHFLGEILATRKALVESLVAAPSVTEDDTRKLIDFKGQIAGVDKILALVRELAEKETE